MVYIQNTLKSQKIACIPPLFYEDKFITDFKKNPELFNYFFVNQCSFLSNNIVLPTDLPQLTNKCLDSKHFLNSNIAKIITHLDPNKAHGHDMLSIWMIKLCGNSICTPLSTIFNDCLNEGKYLHEWKKTKWGIAFKILWILYADVTKILNQQCISFSTAPTFSFLDKPSFRKLGTFMTTFYL